MGSQDYPVAQQCDVLVIGAGPAGSACALTLARAGLDGVLADRQAFPRDKVCGDGLIHDSHQALDKLGVLQEVLQAANVCSHITIIGPHGGRAAIPATVSVLPRKELDWIICQGAQRHGATLLAPATLVSLMMDASGQVNGAILEHLQQKMSIHAKWVVMATGASAGPLALAGMSTRSAPSAMALRVYVNHPGMTERITSLEFVWHRKLAPGYGWIFPCGKGVFNIGVGIYPVHAHDTGKKHARATNLHKAFEAFQEIYPAARELIRGGQMQSAPKGAPFRTSLEGARYAKAGLLVTGEAAGSTYTLTGEGIGKAMETGILAAEALIDARASVGLDGSPEATQRVCQTYESGMAGLKPKFEVYQRVNMLTQVPELVDLLVWRLKRNPSLTPRLTGLLEEKIRPDLILTWRGIRKLLFR